MKSKGKKSPRIIYLNDDAMDISNRLLGESPTGELFRNSAGRAWTTETVNCAIDHVQNRDGQEDSGWQKCRAQRERNCQTNLKS